MNKAIFLDRDGVINVDYGYVYKIDQFEFISGIFDLGRAALKKGYRIIIITNQSGIGRGFYTEADFRYLTRWMCKVFLLEKILISKVYSSPYHPTSGIGKYLKDDYSRKPNPGMIFKAQKYFDINLSNSILIGDKLTDIKAGTDAKVGINLLYSPKYKYNKKFIIKDLKEAIFYLK